MTKPKLTPKKAKYVIAKAEGKTNRDAGLIAGASTPIAADKLAQRLSKDVQVQEALAPILAKHDINLDTAIAPIGQALKAQKVIITGQGDQAFAEVVDDVELRLKGSDRALKLLGVNQEPTGNTYFINVAQEQKNSYGI